MYYIIENDRRPDGIINNTTTVRSTLPLAQSYYHERVSKMLVTNQFTRVALMLADEDLNILDHNAFNIETEE